MGNLLNRLLIMLNSEDPDSTYYHIAMTMLQNFDLLGKLAIQELAELCDVSKSTISKFIRALGFEDFSDFKCDTPFFENKYGNNLNYNSNVLRYLDHHSFEDYVAIAQADLAQALSSIDSAAIDQLAHDLMQYEKVAAFGLMFSETAALDLQTKLAYCKKFIVTSLDDLKQNRFIRSAGEDTLIIVFSNSSDFLYRYQLTTGRIPRPEFHQSKAKVVLITSNQNEAKDPRVAYYIRFKHTSRVQNHRFVYQLISDMIAYRYRELTGQIGV